MKGLTFIMIHDIVNYQILLYFTSLTGNEVWMTLIYLVVGDPCTFWYLIYRKNMYDWSVGNVHFFFCMNK